MRTAEDQAKKTARRKFADRAAARIAWKMHAAMNGGRHPITYDMYREWWNEEGRIAKAAGLYSFSTYYYDAASGLMKMAEERGWQEPHERALAGGGVANVAGDRLARGEGGGG